MIRKLSGLLAGLLITTIAMAGASSSYLISKIYGTVFQNTTYTPGSNVYIALGTGTITSQACTGEVGTGVGYVRVAVTTTSGSWPISVMSGSVSNGAAIAFGTPTGSWGTVNQFCIYDASTSGNLLISASLTTSQAIQNGQAQPTFAIGALSWTVN
jgi:hypothetical protein